MTLSRAVARPLLASMFVVGGIDAIRHAEGKAPAAEKVAPTADAMGLPGDPETLVKLNGGVMVVGGVMLATGRFPRLGALLCAGALIPTTYAGHPFWEESDPEKRAMQRIQFLKNTAMLGGLVIAALDTEGRPSVPWRVRRKLGKTKQAAAPMRAAAATLAQEASALGDALAAHTPSGDQVQEVAGRAADAARHAGDLTVQAAGATKSVARDAAAAVAAAMAAESTRRARASARRAAVGAAHQALGAAQHTVEVSREPARAAATAAAFRTAKLAQEARAALPLAG
jgi:putative oxidoreductase